MSCEQSPLRLTVVAEVLVELSAEIEELGTALCRDPVFVGTHLHTLQAIDLIGQKQRTLASLLTTGMHADAIEDIGIEQLRRKFSTR